MNWKKPRISATVIAAIAGGMLLTALQQSAARAQQVGLDSGDVIDDLKFSEGGVDYSFTVLRDARQRLQYYYVPSQPRIVLEKDGQTGDIVPEIAVVKYQFPDPASAGKLLEGGVAQFSLLFSVPPAALAVMRGELSKRIGTPADQISIGPLPFTSGTVGLYGGDDRTLISATPSGEGTAPTFATQKISFQVPLSKAGLDVYEALLNGNTGFGIRAEYEYQALTPPLGFDVDVDWDQTFSHFSKDEKIRAQVSARALFGLFSANVSYNQQNTTIREALENNKCIKINIIAGSGFDMAQVDKYLQPLLSRISEELLDASKAPPQIAPAAAETPATGNYGFSGGYSVAVKDIKSVKHGVEKISFGVRTIVERKTVVEGFIGTSGFSAAVKKRIFRTIAPGAWEAAYFPLPDVGNAQQLGLSSAGVEVSLVNGGKVVEREAASWNPTDSWKRVGKEEALKYFTFPLAALIASRGDAAFSDLSFGVRYVLNTSNGKVLEATANMPVVNGSTLIPPALSGFNQIQVAPASLNWANLDPKGDVKQLDVSLTIDGKEFDSSLSPQNQNGNWVPPHSSIFLVPNGAKEVIVNMTLFTTDGALLKWAYPNVDLTKLDQRTVPIKGVTARMVAPRREQFID